MARRLIEILQIFDDLRRPATAMEICLRSDWPDSSTRDLLAVMVNCGLLYRDDKERTFQPTPRAAWLGCGAQPSYFQDGRMVRLVDALAVRAGFDMAILGMVGADAQIFWRVARSPDDEADDSLEDPPFVTGAKASLVDTAAGWLMLSTLPQERRTGLLRRLSAEAPAHRSFRPAEIEQRVAACQHAGFAFGPAGFGTGLQICAVMAPRPGGVPPLTIAFVYRPGDRMNPCEAANLLNRSLRASLADNETARRAPNRHNVSHGVLRVPSSAPAASSPQMRRTSADLGSPRKPA